MQVGVHYRGRGRFADACVLVHGVDAGHVDAEVIFAPARSDAETCAGSRVDMILAQLDRPWTDHDTERRRQVDRIREHADQVRATPRFTLIDAANKLSGLGGGRPRVALDVPVHLRRLRSALREIADAAPAELATLTAEIDERTLRAEQLVEQILTVARDSPPAASVELSDDQLPVSSTVIDMCRSDMRPALEQFVDHAGPLYTQLASELNELRRDVQLWQAASR